MNVVTDIVAWFADPAHWSGAGGVPHRVLEHVELCAFATLAAAALAVPAGVVLGHVGRGGIVAVSVVNIGRAVPSFAIVAISLPVAISLGLGLGYWPTFLALFLLALPPMFTNAYTGIRNVEPDVVEAARGMGMRGLEVLWGVELPYAAPVILAATRVAAVQIVATAPLGALVAWGGLGRFIVDGFAQRDFAQVAAGAILVGALAVATELVFGALERLLLSEGVKRLGLAEAAYLVGRAA